MVKKKISMKPENHVRREANMIDKCWEEGGVG